MIVLSQTLGYYIEKLAENRTESWWEKSFCSEYLAAWSDATLLNIVEKCPKKVLPENIEQFGRRQCQN